MYEELVKALRGFEDYDGLDFFENRTYAQDIAREAADAIEELLAERDEVNADSWKTAFEVERDERRWIPVTERLPEQKKAHYLCLLDDDSMAVVYWSKVPDWASKGEWTWHNPNWKEVTHWMPLPQPPKEEKIS